MSESVAIDKTLEDYLPADAMVEVERWISKYPPERRRSAVSPVLAIAQRENSNHLTEELMNAVADYLEIPRIAAYEVATFYTMFELNKPGKHILSVCTNVSCMMAGSNDLLKLLKDQYNVGVGQTTKDGLITVKEVECMAACGGAPMVEVGGVYHENLTKEKLASLLEELE